MRIKTTSLLFCLALAATGCLDKGYLDGFIPAGTLAVEPVCALEVKAFPNDSSEFVHLGDAWTPYGSLLWHGGTLRFAAGNLYAAWNSSTRTVRSNTIGSVTNTWLAGFCVSGGDVFMLHNEWRDDLCGLSRSRIFKVTATPVLCYDALTTNQISDSTPDTIATAIVPDRTGTNIAVLGQGFGIANAGQTWMRSRSFTPASSSMSNWRVFSDNTIDAATTNLLANAVLAWAPATSGPLVSNVVTWRPGRSDTNTVQRHDRTGGVYDNEWTVRSETRFPATVIPVNASMDPSGRVDLLCLHDGGTELRWHPDALSTAPQPSVLIASATNIPQASMVRTADGDTYFAWIERTWDDGSTSYNTLHARARLAGGTLTPRCTFPETGTLGASGGDLWHALNPVFCHAGDGSAPDRAYLKYVTAYEYTFGSYKHVVIVRLVVR